MYTPGNARAIQRYFESCKQNWRKITDSDQQEHQALWRESGLVNSRYDHTSVYLHFSPDSYMSADINWGRKGETKPIRYSSFKCQRSPAPMK